MQNEEVLANTLKSIIQKASTKLDLLQSENIQQRYEKWNLGSNVAAS